MIHKAVRLWYTKLLDCDIPICQNMVLKIHINQWEIKSKNVCRNIYYFCHQNVNKWNHQTVMKYTVYYQNNFVNKILRLINNTFMKIVWWSSIFSVSRSLFRKFHLGMMLKITMNHMKHPKFLSSSEDTGCLTSGTEWMK